MQYNFVEFVKNINLYAIIDGVLLLTFFAIMIAFFVYKRNVKMFIFLLAAIVLEVLVMVLSELFGGTILTVSKYMLHYVVIFNLIATAVVYQNDLKNIFQNLITFI